MDKNSEEAIDYVMNRAVALLMHDADQNYRNSPFMALVAKHIVQAFIKEDFGSNTELQEYRDKIESVTTEKYEAVFAFGPFGLGWDMQAELNRKKVPRDLQIKHGLMDLIITYAQRMGNKDA